MRIHVWYYSEAGVELQDLHCINIYNFLPQELGILLILRSAPGTALCAPPAGAQ